jgi:hypothetical protein
MRSLVLRTGTLLTALCVAAAGCTDSVAPEPAAPGVVEGGPARGLVSALLVNVLQRIVPLGRDYTATATIGEAGGTIRIREAGFSITFPAGAIRGAPVAIRATALAGSNVAYRLEPHGLVFRREPVITQDLGVTQVLLGLLSLRQLEGAYVADESQLDSGTATVVEVRPAKVDLLRMRMSFDIRHFSAYVASTGRRAGYISSTGNRISTGAPVVGGQR